jgi:predicted lipid-binding transport protein (Tim44 family)
MNSAMIQLIVLAGIAVFLILKLRGVLGTRDGFESSNDQRGAPVANGAARDFEVIEGGLDLDVADHIDIESKSGKALVAMKTAEPGFSVSEFLSGGRQAYEMILMAFERGDLDTLKLFLSKETFESFKTVVDARAEQGLVIDATFVGVREVKIIRASFSQKTKIAEITMRFVAELTSVVRKADGEVIEGDPTAIKRQKDIWTFARTMGSNDPNWELVATGE